MQNIVVVGAGPVGTVAALACARAGHRVTLLEAESRIDDSPRASTTQPPTAPGPRYHPYGPKSTPKANGHRVPQRRMGHRVDHERDSAER